jgi:hypothetical protein
MPDGTFRGTTGGAAGGILCDTLADTASGTSSCCFEAASGARAVLAIAPPVVPLEVPRFVFADIFIYHLESSMYLLKYFFLHSDLVGVIPSRECQT